MIQFISRYPVLTDSRALTLVAAVALALVSLVVSGDPASAGARIIITGGPHN